MVEMTEYTPGTPSWVDLSSPDVEAAKAFYSGVFGWDAMTIPGPEAGGYTFFTKNDKMVCGVGPTQSAEQHPAWSTYVSVDDADATAQAVRDNGGQVAVPPMDVMGAGRMAVFIDPTGAFFSVWQPGEHKGAQIINEPGSFVWNELDTRDMDAAKAFYTKVFPWTAETLGEGEGAYTQWKLDGRSIAGAMQMGASFPPDLPANWLTYFAVTDLEGAITKAKEGGGTVAMPGMDTEQGRFAVIIDPHGAAFAVIQPK